MGANIQLPDFGFDLSPEMEQSLRLARAAKMGQIVGQPFSPETEQAAADARASVRTPDGRNPYTGTIGAPNPRSSNPNDYRAILNPQQREAYDARWRPGSTGAEPQTKQGAMGKVLAQAIPSLSQEEIAQRRASLQNALDQSGGVKDGMWTIHVGGKQPAYAEDVQPLPVKTREGAQALAERALRQDPRYAQYQDLQRQALEFEQKTGQKFDMPAMRVTHGPEYDPLNSPPTMSPEGAQRIAESQARKEFAQNQLRLRGLARANGMNPMALGQQFFLNDLANRQMGINSADAESKQGAMGMALQRMMGEQERANKLLEMRLEEMRQEREDRNSERQAGFLGTLPQVVEGLQGVDPNMANFIFTNLLKARGLLPEGAGQQQAVQGSGQLPNLFGTGDARPGVPPAQRLKLALDNAGTDGDPIERLQKVGDFLGPEFIAKNRPAFMDFVAKNFGDQALRKAAEGSQDRQWWDQALTGRDYDPSWANSVGVRDDSIIPTWLVSWPRLFRKAYDAHNATANYLGNAISGE